ncbi:hypothetical protein J6590_004048 [Homalodisca vitripennis]|nr:hypothetical protein J6590_004048 [Homalodisca vitripennis]
MKENIIVIGYENKKITSRSGEVGSKSEQGGAFLIILIFVLGEAVTVIGYYMGRHHVFPVRPSTDRHVTAATVTVTDSTVLPGQPKPSSRWSSADVICAGRRREVPAYVARGQKTCVPLPWSHINNSSCQEFVSGETETSCAYVVLMYAMYAASLESVMYGWSTQT